MCGVGPLDTLPGRVIGAKPAAVCRWIFALLGAAPGDSLDDLFLGSGAVGRAWAAYTGQPPSTRAVYASWKACADARTADLAQAADGWQYSLWPRTGPGTLRGWLGQAAFIDAPTASTPASRTFRTGKDTGLDHFPSFDYQVNGAWLTASMTGQILLAWLKLLALPGDGQSRAQDPGIPGAARGGPPGPRRPG